TPHAIGHAIGQAIEVATGSRNPEQEGRPSRSGLGTASPPVTTAAEALDRTDLWRMRSFHIFGIFASMGAIALSAFLGGDPTYRQLFWIGVSVLGACNVVLLYLT